MQANQSIDNKIIASIMLVEDSLADQTLIRRALEDANIQCNLLIANNGIEALQILKDQSTNIGERYNDLHLLVLLDINMPLMGGIETLQTIRNTEELKHLPVVMLTTSSSDHDIRQAYRSGANAYLTKPMEEKDFVSIAKKIEEFWFNLAKLPAL
ncbi:response regulator [Aurantivibrio plasticivorans]